MADTSGTQTVRVGRQAPRSRWRQAVARAGKLLRRRAAGSETRAWHLPRPLGAALAVVQPLGWVVAGCVPVCWVLAAREGWDEAALISGGALALVVATILFVLGRTPFRGQLDLLPARVVAGGDTVASLHLENTSSGRTLPLHLAVPVGDAMASFEIPSIAGAGTVDEVFTIGTERRSVIPVGPVTAERGDPFGLMRRTVLVGEAVDLFVHPRTVDILGFTAGWLRDLDGQETRDRSPSDLAFHALREYVPGDDRRHIHWPSSARQPDGTLMVREFVDTRRSNLALVLPTSPTHYADPDEFELAVSAIASLGLAGIRAEQELVLLTGSGRMPAYTAQSFLDTLSKIALDDAHEPLESMALRLRDQIATASAVFTAAGSTTDLASLSRAADRYGVDVKSLGVRVGVADSSLTVTGRSTLIEAGSLEEFARVLWVASRT
jgi:uncharacterized protein (DUF58 family)